MSNHECKSEKISKPALSQDDLDDIASTLGINYQVEDNFSGGRALFSASITLTNGGRTVLEHSAEGNVWAIYFSHLRMVEPNYLPADKCVDLEYAGIRISHLNGSIFKLSPLKSFKSLQRGDSVFIQFNGQHYSASRSDILPNWYIHVEGLEPRIIKSTEGESLDFVGMFDLPKRYKRFDYALASGERRYDLYQPFTPEVRFSRYVEPKEDLSHINYRVVPTPVRFELKSEQTFNILEAGFRIACDTCFSQEAKYLSAKSNIPLLSDEVSSFDVTPSQVIMLRSDLKVALEGASDSEAYEIVTDASNRSIQISACAAPGAFYGVQTLLSLSAQSSVKQAGQVPHCYITDAPRFSFRGMHADISRNFQPKEEILKLLDVMAMYKLNKFHFHLTDDEGWRLEIPGLDQLTQVGAKRGHDLSEKVSLMPLLGSGPFPTGLGCGYYTVEDYRDILRHAHQLHIQVIPEIDMPGHSHAAVRAMKVRYQQLMAQNKQEEAEMYLLSDLAEENLPHHHAYSVQMLAENSMNPGLESTYRFVDKVIRELKEMHRDIQPLTIFHLGGDEVPFEAWDESPACLALVESGKIADIDDLMEHFVVRVGELAHKHGLDLGAWQDGIVTKASGPYQRSKFSNPTVLVHFWRNVWEIGQAFDAYKLANNDYEVILAPGTHLYFDHPYEPDPEERGLYWACRFIDTHKVFRFAPCNLMSNADVKLTGEKLTKLDRKMLYESEDSTVLNKPENIKGIQGQIWTELVRTPKQFHEMIFPRLVAMAERAWHKAPWEDLDVSERLSPQLDDWSDFAHTLSHKEIKRLEDMSVPYHIPPPGARLSGDGKLELRSCYPGLPMVFSLDKGQTWQPYSTPVDVAAHEEVDVRGCSHNGKDHGRSVKISIKSFTDSDVPSS